MEKKLTKESMSSKLITINWGEQIEIAYHRMQKHHLRHLPVLNETGDVVGMLSDRDVQRAMISEIKHEGRVPAFSETIHFNPDALVRDYMSWPVITVEKDANIREIAEKMMENKVSSFLVKSGSKIIGIVTTEDLLKVLIDLLKDPKTQVRWNLEEILAQTYNPLNGLLV